MFFSSVQNLELQVDSVTLSGLLVLFQKYSFRPGEFFIEEDYGPWPCESLEHVWTSEKVHSGIVPQGSLPTRPLLPP